MEASPAAGNGEVSIFANTFLSQQEPFCETRMASYQKPLEFTCRHRRWLLYHPFLDQRQKEVKSSGQIPSTEPHNRPEYPRPGDVHQAQTPAILAPDGGEQRIDPLHLPKPPSTR